MTSNNFSNFQVIVNPLSGGGSGKELYAYLQQLLPKENLHNLIEDDIPSVLQKANEDSTVIVCGGDGSIAGLFTMAKEINCEIPIGVIPLGTGNDMSRFAGLAKWKLSNIKNILLEAKNWKPIKLDSWQIKGEEFNRDWYNYCSFGLDAKISYKFDLLRKKHRKIFFSPIINKLAYVVLGIDTGSKLNKKVILEKEYNASARSIIFTNISSYAGGFCLSKKINVSDGLCDLITIPGGINAGLSMAGILKPNLISQKESHKIEIKHPIIMQIDGEAERIPAGKYEIIKSKQVNLLSSAKEKQ